LSGLIKQTSVSTLIKAKINLQHNSCDLKDLFVITVTFIKCVRYNHETLLIKHAEPNQATHFVRYNRDRYITKLDCTSWVVLMGKDEDFGCGYIENLTWQVFRNG